MYRGVAGLSCLLAAMPSLLDAQQFTAIQSVAVVDVSEGRVRPESTVLIENGRITTVGPASEVSIPPGSLVIDGTGRWLIPGLIETHTHTTGRNGLRRALALGVTSALVIHTGPSPTQEFEADSWDPAAAMPRVHLVGGRFSAEFPGDLIPGAPRFSAPQSADEARSQVLAVAERGFRAIKIWQDDAAVWVGEAQMPIFPVPLMKALVDAAHDQGLKVYVHAWDPAFFREALPLEVDGFVHPILSPMSASDVEQLANLGLPWVSTFSLLLEYGDPTEFARRVTADPRLARGISAAGWERYRAAVGGDPRQYRGVFPALVERLSEYMEVVAANARLAHEAGLRIAVGSDAAAGYGTHIEIELLQEAGLNPVTILRAATLGGAQFLGRERDLGSVEAGKTADLVLLDENPLNDARNLRSVFLILKGGIPFDPAEIGEQGGGATS